MHTTIIGIVGPIGAGKDVIAEYVAQKYAIPCFQISQPLKDIAKERGLEITRDNLVELGTQLAHEEGPDFLAKKILATVTTPLAMITGMRQLAQINFLRKNAHLILLSVDADPVIRFARAVERKKQGEATTLTEFVAHEQAENSGHHVQRLFECMKLADYSIENNGSLDDFKEKIEVFLRFFNLVK